MPQSSARPFRTRFMFGLIAVATLSSMTVAGTPDLASAAPGAQRWVQRYNGLSAGTDFASDGAVSPDGSTVFVTGAFMKSSEDHDIATIAYGSTHGPRLWVRRYDGPDSLSDHAYSVSVSPDDSAAFVVGDSDSDIHLDDYLTIAYNLK